MDSALQGRQGEAHPSDLGILAGRSFSVSCALTTWNTSTEHINRYIVSPWQQHGTAIEYVRKERSVNVKKLVGLILLFSSTPLTCYQILGVARGVQVLHHMDPPIVHGEPA
jgi:hypothetical protein